MEQAADVIRALNNWPLAFVILGVLFFGPVRKFINEIVAVRIKVRELEGIVLRRRLGEDINEALLTIGDVAAPSDSQ